MFMKKIAVTFLCALALMTITPQKVSADAGLTLGIIGTALGGAALGSTLLHQMNRNVHYQPQAYYPLAGGYGANMMSGGGGCGCQQKFRQNCGGGCGCGSAPAPCQQQSQVYPRPEAIVPVYQSVQPIYMPYAYPYPVYVQTPAPAPQPIVIQYEAPQQQARYVEQYEAPARRVSVVEERIPVRGNW